MNSHLKCQICGAPATIHMTQIIDGKAQEIHLCENCTRKNIFSSITKFAELIAGKIMGKKEGKPVGRKKKGKTCPNCGLTEPNFKEGETLGCSRCYEVFSDEIQEVVQKLHTYDRLNSLGGKSSIQKTKTKGAPKAKTTSLAELKRQLKCAVEQEDYAEAAKLRDQIREKSQKKTSKALESKPKAPRKKSQKKEKPNE